MGHRFGRRGGGGGGGGGREGGGVTALSEPLVQNHIGGDRARAAFGILPPSPTPWGLSPHQFLSRDHLALSKSNNNNNSSGFSDS